MHSTTSNAYVSAYTTYRKYLTPYLPLSKAYCAKYKVSQFKHVLG